jgi:hypothetical protein
VIPFDTTGEFDNAVVTEYLDGTTKNPLVHHHANPTLESDLRIFSSDGNATVTELADTNFFMETCKTSLARMLDTVPSSVTLTEPLQPIEPKVGRTLLTTGTNGLVLRTSLRLRATGGQRTVTLTWVDKFGQQSSVSSAEPTDVSSPYAKRMGVNLVKYTFSPSFSADSSIKQFWFQIDDGTTTTVVDNGGSRYGITQDRVLFVPHLSSKLGKTYTVIAAVRAASGSVFAETFDRDGAGGLPVTGRVDFTRDSSIPPVAGYKFYRGVVTGGKVSFDLTAQYPNGQKYQVIYAQTSMIH